MAASSPIDYSKLPNDIIVDLINLDNGTQLTSGLLSFSDPKPLTEGPCNTLVIASAAPNSGFRGSVTFFYNRRPITDMVGVQSLDFFIGTAQSWREMIPLINFRFGIHLTLNDIIDGPIKVNEGQTLSAILKMAPTSLIYLGELTTNLVGTTPQGIALGSVITDRYLHARRIKR